MKRKKYSYIWARSRRTEYSARRTRAAKYSLEDKQDPEKRAEFKEKLTQYLLVAKQQPERVQLWFWDETGFSLRVIRRKSWGKKGTRTKVTGQRRHGRVNVMGGLREQDKKRVCFFVKKGEAGIFYEQLEQLNEFVKNEWVEQGNLIADFPKQGPKIIIFLDNASYHKRLDIREKIAQELPNIVLEFLPAYSPDFNVIELVWHSCKEYIAPKAISISRGIKRTFRKITESGRVNYQVAA